MVVRSNASSELARGLRAAGLLLLSLTVLPATANAEWRTMQRTMFCRDHNEFTEALAVQHQEARAWWGVSGDGKALFELYWSPETGSWTLLRIEDDGFACALGGGDAGALAIGPEGGEP